MSAADAFTAVALNQALNSAAEYGASAFQGNRNNGQSNYDRLLAKYNQLADRWNNLVGEWDTLVARYTSLRDNYEKDQEVIQTSFRQTYTLMAYINGGRLAQGLPAVLYPQVQFAVYYDPQMKNLREIMEQSGIKSKIGVISQTDLFWDSINAQVFKPFAEAMTNAGNVAPDHLFAGANAAALRNGIYGEMTGWQEKQRLQDENAALKRELAEVKRQLAAKS